MQSLRGQRWKSGEGYHMTIAQLASFLAAVKAEQDRNAREQQEQAQLPAPELHYDRTTADRRSPYDDGIAA